MELITVVKVLSEWHYCALCSIKNQMYFCCASHWLWRDIFQAANSFYEAILVFFRIKGKRELFSVCHCCWQWQGLSALQQGYTRLDPQALYTAPSYCLQSPASLCQLGIWPSTFKPSSALFTFSLAINSAELWPLSLFWFFLMFHLSDLLWERW